MATTELNRSVFEQADAALGCGKLAWRHIHAEWRDEDVPAIVETLASVGPYAMSAYPDFDSAGNPVQYIYDSRERIAEYYAFKKDRSRSISFDTRNEHRASWYVFAAGLLGGMSKTDGTPFFTETAVLFPILGRDGITGELFATKDFNVKSLFSTSGEPTQEASSNSGGEPYVQRCVANVAAHNKMMQGFRANDLEMVLSTMSDRVQTTVRDYVEDDGRLTELHTLLTARNYFRDFLSENRVIELDFVTRMCEDWYVFSEWRWKVETRGRKREFLTAQLCRYDDEGKLWFNIGHGTDGRAL